MDNHRKVTFERPAATRRMVGSPQYDFTCNLFDKQGGHETVFGPAASGMTVLTDDLVSKNFGQKDNDKGE